MTGRRGEEVMRFRVEVFNLGSEPPELRGGFVCGNRKRGGE